MTLSFWTLVVFAFCFGSFYMAYSGENRAGYIWAAGAGLFSYYLFRQALNKWRAHFAWRRPDSRPNLPPTL